MNRLTSISSNTNIKLPKHFNKYFIIGYSSHVDPLIETIPYLSHARSRNFGCTLNPSIPIIFDRFAFKLQKKITRLLGTIKNTVSLRFVSLPFPSKNRPPRGHVLTGNRQSNDRLLISSSPHRWELCVFVAKFLRSSTLLTELSFRRAFYVVRVVVRVVLTWLIYVRAYCVPIATLNQNKRSRKLYFGWRPNNDCTFAQQSSNRNKRPT